LIGLPFLLAGVFVVLVAANVIPVPDESFQVSRKVVGGAGIALSLIGVLILSLGCHDIARVRRRERLTRLRPGEPWYADYPWQAKGISDKGIHNVLMPVFSLLILVCILAPINYVAFYRPDLLEDAPPWVLQVLSGCIDAAGVACLLWVFYRILRFLKYGSSFLHFKQSPFFLGDKLVVGLTTSRAMGAVRWLEATLRCIEERYERSYNSRGRRTTIVVCYQLYADTVRSDTPREFRRGSPPLSMSIPIPANLPSTALSDRPPTYWELEIKAGTPGVDYNAVFLVPIYVQYSERAVEGSPRRRVQANVQRYS